MSRKSLRNVDRNGGFGQEKFFWGFLLSPRVRSAFLFFLFLSLGVAGMGKDSIAVGAEARDAGGEEGIVRKELMDDGRALINPDMGWTAHFYSNIPTNYGSQLSPDDTLDWFEGCSAVYLRVPWAYLEPEEGVYNWALLDTPAARWIAKGKQVGFRFTTSENWIPYATPEWVFKAGAKKVAYRWGEGPDENGTLFDPVYDDPVYLEKLENFLKAAAARYDGNPDIAFIDVGTFGMWGEGHTFGSSRLSPEENVRMAKIHVDLHRRLFPNTQLFVVDDVIGPQAPGDDFPLMDDCVRQGIGLRDDSILVQPYPDHWYHSELAQKFWPTTPVFLEHEHYGSSILRGAWDEELLQKAVEDYHASWLSIHWWPEVEWRECQETIRKINRRLGYRIVAKSIEYPSRVSIDDWFEVTIVWSNAGVAPCYRGGFPTLTLKDEKGGIVAVLSDETFDVKDLPVGPPEEAPEISHTARFRIGHVAPTTKPGTYDVYLSVGRRDGTPVFALPYPEDDGARRYKIGRIELR